MCFQLQISKQIEGFFKHNFFAEYHGKNYVDGHFGRLSQWFKKIEAVQKIETVDQLLVLFKSEEATRVTNFYSSNPGKILSGENYFYKYEVYERANKEFIDIEDIQHYLSFLFIENKLMASVVTIDELSSYSEVPYLF